MNPGQKPAIDLCSGLLAHHQETSVKKEQKPLRSNTPLSKQEKSKITITTKPVIDLSVSSALGDKPLPKVDTDNVHFPELQAAYDLALTALLDAPEADVKENKKDKKKGTTPDSDAKRKWFYLKLQVTL